MHRRIFIGRSLACLAIASVAGCESTPRTRTSSKEIVSSVLISADETALVVMTPQFHYIFGIPAPVLAALKGSFHAYVQATFSQFHVDEKGKTSGAVSLFVSMAPPAAIDAAVGAGFTKNSSGAVFTTELQGDRYSAGAVQPSAQYQLNKTYSIDVEAEGHQARPSPIEVAGTYLTVFGVLLVLAPAAIASR